MKRLIILSLVFLAACSKPMTNDEIIKEINKCKKAGLSYRLMENYDGSLASVRCK